MFDDGDIVTVPMGTKPYKVRRALKIFVKLDKKDGRQDPQEIKPPEGLIYMVPVEGADAVVAVPETREVSKTISINELHDWTAAKIIELRLD